LKKSMTNYLKAAAAVGALAFAATQASAVPINGSVLLNGSALVAQVGPVTTVTLTGVPWSVAGASGDYSTEGLSAGNSAAVNSISYTGTGAAANLVAPVVPQWSITDGDGTIYTFDLLSLTSAVFSPGVPASIAMSGSGTAHIGGTTTQPYEATQASWSLQGTGTGVLFQFASEGTTAFGVPDVTTSPDGGTTAALLGLGFAGVAALRRNRR
jgi:hypothetical protein